MCDPIAEAPYPDLAAWPKVRLLGGLLKERFPFMAAVVDRMWAGYGSAWASQFEAALAALNGPDALTPAVEGYVKFAIETQRLQHKFFKTGDYPTISFDQAAREVYLNDSYMQSEYLPGLLLSHYLWRHHYDLARFFDLAFIEPMRIAAARGPVDFVDIGIGTGLYSTLVLSALPQARGTGYDLSPSAKVFTEERVRAIGAGERYSVRLTDILETGAIPPTHWLISVELLEHLPDPGMLMRRVHDVLAPGGRAFLVAALNSPHPDHIYLYRTPQEVRDQADAAGLTVDQTYSAIASGHRKGGPGAPEVAALVISKPEK